VPKNRAKLVGAWRGVVTNYIRNEESKSLILRVASILARHTGKPLHQSNILRRTLHPILENLNEPKCGCHAFRRFRITHLRKNDVPEDLVHYWVGHAGKSVTDAYRKSRLDLAFRKEVAERVGLGFEFPPKKTAIGPNGPKLETEPAREMVACA
jgi:integrase